jgi:hypothetical protein
MVFAVLLALAAVGSAVAGPDGAPRYRFKQGEKLAYVVDATTRIETTGLGRSNSAIMSQTIDLTWEVNRVDANGKATITQTIERIVFRAVTPGGTMSHDTKGPPSSGTEPADPQLREAYHARRRIVERLNAVVGARLSATIDPQGRIADIRLIERSGGGAGPAGDWGGLGNPASEAGFRRLMGQLIPLLSEKAPAQGESWSIKGEEKVPGGKTITETRYTCEGEEERQQRRLQKLALAVTRTTENETGEAVGSSKGSGAAYFDPVAGRLIESALTHAREQQVSVADQKVTKTVTETITLKLAE